MHNLEIRKRCIEAVQADPNRSSNDIANELGVSLSAVKRALFLARQGKKNYKRNRAAEKQHIMKHDGYANAAEAISAIAKLRASGGDWEAERKRVGLSQYSYQQGCDIILLSQRDDLTADESEKIAAAIKFMNERRQARVARRMVEPIAQRVWSRKAPRFARASEGRKKRNALLQSISFVLTTCTASAELVVPDLTESLRESILTELNDAIDALHSLKARITKREAPHD